MGTSSCLPRTFYDRSVLTVARQLLGTRLVRVENSLRLSGTIVETEAYRGEEDLGCHAHAGRTPRTAVMYGPPGHAYIYFTYGMHWLLNCVCEKEGFPAAVLLRAVFPQQGQERMLQLRPRPRSGGWLDGPAKLCQGMGIDGRLNGVDLCDPDGELFLEHGVTFPDEQVRTTARIGLFSVPEPWKSIPWRFVVDQTQAGRSGLNP